jgi:ribosomal protein L7/L12
MNFHIDVVARAAKDPAFAFDVVIEMAKKCPEQMQDLECMGSSWVNKVKNLAISGEKVEAIKLCRSMTGWSLDRAKDYVDNLC